MVNIYTEQALDNLVRARTNQPFVQLTYRDLLVQDTDMYLGEITNAQAVTHSTQLTLTQTLSRMFTATVANTLTPRVNASRSAQMSFHADVVTDKNDVYQMYLAFARNDAFFRASDGKPDCKPRYMKKDCGHYYYVPPEAEPAFQDLVLRTALMRGPETVPPGYYESRILEASAKKQQDPLHPDSVIAKIRLNSKIPNGAATMVILFPSGGTAQLPLLTATPDNAAPVKPAPAKPDGTEAANAAPAPEGVPAPLEDKGENFVDVPPGQLTDLFEAIWQPKSALTPFTPEQLRNLPVRIFSHDYPPPMTSSNPVLQQIRDDVNRIRAAQSTTIGTTITTR